MVWGRMLNRFTPYLLFFLNGKEYRYEDKL